jgi:hypothetical protein
MSYTPRQLQAFLFLAQQRRQHDLRDLLQLNALAARGDANTLRRQLKDWET